MWFTLAFCSTWLRTHTCAGRWSYRFSSQCRGQVSPFAHQIHASSLSTLSCTGRSAPISQFCQDGSFLSDQSEWKRDGMWFQYDCFGSLQNSTWAFIASRRRRSQFWLGCQRGESLLRTCLAWRTRQFQSSRSNSIVALRLDSLPEPSSTPAFTVARIAINIDKIENYKRYWSMHQTWRRIDIYMSVSILTSICS